MDEFKVSAIITTYKRPLDVLKRSLDSVLNQTYKNLEIIIVDDSPENFDERKLIEDYLEQLKEDRLIYIKHPKNVGANSARNTGIKNSTGYYIAFLDDDDSWAPQKIEKQIKVFSDEEVGMVYCKAQFIMDSGNKREVDTKLKRGYIFDDLLYENFIGGTSFVMFTKEALLMVGGFTETLLSNQDWDVYLQIAKNFKIDYVDEVLVNYYWHRGERITSDVNKKIQGWQYLYKLYYKQLIERPTYLSLWELKISYFYLKKLKIWKFLKLSFGIIGRTPKLFLKFWINTCIKVFKIYIQESSD